MQHKGLWHGSVPQKVRLVSGLVLFAFAATHFINHALGLVSLQAMLALEEVRTAVTRSGPGTLVLLGALLAHAALGLWSALRRRSWTMPVGDWVQVALGIAIPVLLLPHIVSTRIAAALFGVRTDYPYELAHIWPMRMLDQSVLLLLVWAHGCIGIHFWLRSSDVYARIRPVLYALAVLVPFAALAGVSVQGRDVEATMADPQGAAALKAATAWPTAAEAGTLALVSDRTKLGYGLAVVAFAIVAGGLLLLARRRRHIEVRYVGGPVVRTEPGTTLLDVSRRHGVPHLSVCGGRGRCSTCRVQVMNAGAGVPPPSAAERKTLRAIGAGPHVRLACQTVPIGAVTIMPLLKAHAASLAAGTGPGAQAGDGVERDLAVLFVDLRGFTALTERKLPFDVIYILNQFFSTVGQPVVDCGGWIANYAGDGLIALFGDDKGIDGACRAALLACVQIDRAMSSLSERLLQETRTPLRIAMGLHAGPHVMGRVGFGAAQPMSVVGLAINVASRLEGLAKQHGVQLALSGTVARFGGLDTRGFRTEPIEVRGLSEPLDVVLVAAAGDLVIRLGASEQVAAADLAEPLLP